MKPQETPKAAVVIGPILQDASPAEEKPLREGSAAPLDAAAAARAKTARFVVTKPAAAPSLGFPLWAVAVALVVVCAGGVRWTLKHSVADDYAVATRLVTDYERGKKPSSINYADPLYDETIQRLRNVPMSSPSAGDAARMLADLEAKRGAFAERLKESEARMAQTLATKEAREAEVLERQARTTGIDPQAAMRLQEKAATAPGCQDEERNFRRGLAKK